ncbi:hypothetical protein NDU88_001696 [Pleurodeles waltl]|uniref:Uncharacterized protein n=1 Tax=Pleurodeles waltl TaxID=8319 RepID=A0AAV7SCB8_PLEWA|nr:hypothetical protein NDU88_001696 [Pleurodeles waltl]
MAEHGPPGKSRLRSLIPQLQPLAEVDGFDPVLASPNTFPFFCSSARGRTVYQKKSKNRNGKHERKQGTFLLGPVLVACGAVSRMDNFISIPFLPSRVLVTMFAENV